jgi:membrane associated rhomboid family serine protease
MSGVAHFAHLGGLVGGFVLMRLWRVRASRR